MALLLSVASTAGAAGLGKLAVLSAMGEPFRAEIDLLGVTDGEERTVLTPRLAPPGMYLFADFRYNPALVGASLDIRARSNGRRVIEIISAQPINEPFVYFLIELESSTTRMIRGYTALLDPHGYHAPRGVVMAAEFPSGMVRATAAPVIVSAISPAPQRVPAARRTRDSTTQPDATAKTLAGMLQRVAALEVAVAQLQHRLETPDAAVVAQKPVVEEPSLNKPDESKKIPAAVSAPPVPVPAKPMAPVESAPHHAGAQDSLLNEALLGLVIGLLLLLGGLVYVMRGRSAATV